MVIDQEATRDAANIAQGVYCPLEGFLKKDDFVSVVRSSRLTNGKVWPLPIILSIDEAQARRIKRLSKLLLKDQRNNRVAVLKEIEVYPVDKDFLAANVFQTLDQAHPGVAGAYQMKDYLLGGRLDSFNSMISFLPSFCRKYYFTPQETRSIFRARGWRKIAAFQTRNVPHRSHEALHKKALETADALFIQPVVGKKKSGDFKDSIILKSYEELIKNHYPKERVHLGILPVDMKYAGPKEALFHALVRKNFGCTEMIIGRDHAGVGNYYEPYAAQKIFDQFTFEEIGINILKYRDFCFCRRCGDLVEDGGCSHHQKDKLLISGTAFREMVKAKHPLPEEAVRPEVAKVISASSRPFI